MEDIHAIPRATVIDLPASGDEAPSVVALEPVATSTSEGVCSEPSTIAATIRRVLDQYLAAIAERYAGVQTFVCLSGGLDSSGIAALAREHFPDMVGVSFDLKDAGSFPSDDRMTARRLARDLGLDLLEVTATPQSLLDAIDIVLIEGADWRDFNVHAGLVNAAIAAALAEQLHAQPALVLTGDLPNEFLADYHPEIYRGRTYYPLPRLPVQHLRNSLVRGLDTSNRETGVFGAWDLPVAQPYAAAVDAYMLVPGEFLRLPDAKQRLSRESFGRQLPEYVDADAEALDQLMRAGMHRSAIPTQG
jgi:asparagine synthetase B (glutamine-hydrolysing)